MGRRPISALTALTAVLLSLSACNGDPEPQVADPTSEPPTSEPTTSPTATESTPTEPPTSEPPEKETAQEFLRRWQEAANEMQVSGVSDKFRALNADCESCDVFAGNVDRIYEAGGFIRTDGGTISGIERWGKVNEWPTFDVRVESAPI